MKKSGYGQLKSESELSGKIGFLYARDDTAASHELEHVDDETECDAPDKEYPRCRYTEELYIDLTTDFLNSRFETGFELRLKSRRGPALYISVPANVIQGQFLAVYGSLTPP